MFSGNALHRPNQNAVGTRFAQMYACCGATDYYMETGDPTYLQTLNKLWADMTSTKMYVTGGVGSRSDGEAFGDAYELPNFRAYGRKLRSYRQHDVELAHARHYRRSEVYRRDGACAL